MNVYKKDFIEQLVEKHHYTKKSATDLVDDFWDVLLDNIEHGNPVFFYGYGCFDMVERKGRAFKTPQGDPCATEDQWVPRFYPGNMMRRAVKKWADNEKRGLV